MQRVLDAGPGVRLVTVEGGINAAPSGGARRARLALPNQGDIDAQTLAGATATATHGTGATFPNLSAAIVALRLVTAAGDALELAPERDRRRFLAARVGARRARRGRARSRCAAPAFSAAPRGTCRVPGRDADRLDEHVDGNDHFEFWASGTRDAR